MGVTQFEPTRQNTSKSLLELRDFANLLELHEFYV